MAPTALAFAIFDLPQGNASMLSAVLTAQTIPLVLLLPLGGALADRIGRARIIGITDVILSAVVFYLAYLFWTTDPQLPTLVAIAVVMGTLNALWWPAYPGLPADLVDEDYLQSANAYISFGSNFSIMTGAAAGGLLVAAYGGAVAIAVDALSFLVAGLIVWTLRHTSSRSQSGNSLFREIHEGWQVFWSYKWVVVVVAAFSLIVMAVRATEGVLGPLIAKENFDGAVSWGQVVSAQGAGYLLGAVVATKWRPSRPMVAGMLVTIPAAFFMTALAVVAPLPVIMITAALWGLGIELMVVWWFTALQTNIPKEAIGRVSAYDAFGSLLLGPIGLALAGPLSETLGTRVVLLSGAVLVIVMVALSLLSRELRNLRGQTQPAT